jgi:hypothetical protein
LALYKLAATENMQENEEKFKQSTCLLHNPNILALFTIIQLTQKSSETKNSWLNKIKKIRKTGVGKNGIENNKNV